MKSILFILNQYYWKSISAPFFTFIVPPIFILILGNVLDPKIVLPGLISMCPLILGTISLPQVIFEFKQSVLLKRIGVAAIKPIHFIMIISAYYCVLMFVSVLFALAFSMAIFSGSFTKVFGYVDYGQFLFAQLLNIILSIELGMMIASFFKTLMAIQVAGFFMVIVTLFLSGMVIAPIFLSQKPGMLTTSYIMPHKYPTDLAIQAWGANVNWIDNYNMGLNVDHIYNPGDMGYKIGSPNGNFIPLTLNGAADPLNGTPPHTWFYDKNTQILFAIKGDFKDIITSNTFTNDDIIVGSRMAGCNINHSTIWNMNELVVYNPIYDKGHDFFTQLTASDKKLDWGISFVYMLSFLGVSLYTFEWSA